MSVWVYCQGIQGRRNLLISLVGPSGRAWGGMVVSDRNRREPLLVTNNRAPQTGARYCPNLVAAESRLDRLINTSHQILMDGPSYRPRKRPEPPSPDADHPSSYAPPGSPEPSVRSP